MPILPFGRRMSIHFGRPIALEAPGLEPTMPMSQITVDKLPFVRATICPKSYHLVFPDMSLPFGRMDPRSNTAGLWEDMNAVFQSNPRRLRPLGSRAVGSHEARRSAGRDAG